MIVEAEAKLILAKLNYDGVLSHPLQEALADFEEGNCDDYDYDNVDDLFCDIAS